jgi:hypothetical protein
MKAESVFVSQAPVLHLFVFKNSRLYLCILKNLNRKLNIVNNGRIVQYQIQILRILGHRKKITNAINFGVLKMHTQIHTLVTFIVLLRMPKY